MTTKDYIDIQALIGDCPGFKEYNELTKYLQFQRACAARCGYYYSPKKKEELEEEKQLVAKITKMTVSINYKNISIENHSIKDEFPIQIIKQLWEQAPESGFGDMQKMETAFDRNIRYARELTTEHFSVSPELIQQMQEWWNQDFYPKNVRIEPYKINIYGKDSHFAPHKDTPSNNLVGTMIYGLAREKNCSSVLEIETGTIKKPPTPKFIGCLRESERIFKGQSMTACAFYPDVTHQVTKMNEDLVRATISFKVFADEPQPDNIAQALKQQAITMLSRFQKPIGFLLSHQYSIDSMEQTLKGTDGKLYEVLKAVPGTRIEFLPVMIKFKAEWNACDDYDNYDYDGCSSQVFPLTQDVIKYVLGRGEEPKINLRKVRFFQREEGYLWEYVEDQGASYTGNESRNGSLDCVYVFKAIILV
eukprot:TRINITY_DN1470_c0_g1_i2.p1 TRINITY_DN1470_c0_g1~~TRINITY_DN1470_c0_g1_i2.p1  ORF type:complete len:419 (-),score=67.92 TRINITY_DN1470_c0_g1_i2:29-1285(-)